MPNAKLSSLTSNTAPVGTDLLYIVDDPGGTPLSQKITVAALLATPSPTLVTPVIGAATGTSLRLADGNSTAPAFSFTGATGHGMFRETSSLVFASTGSEVFRISVSPLTLRLATSGVLSIGDTVKLTRDGADDIMGLSGGTNGAALRLTEMTAPAAGAANTVRIFAQDNGSGKTQLMAIFASGAAQQFAIEP